MSALRNQKQGREQVLARLSASQMSQLDSWLEVCEWYARHYYGGHLSIMRFTMGWKAVFGTPWLEPVSADYFEMLALNASLTSELACLDLLIRNGYVTWAEARQVENLWKDAKINA